MPEHAQTRMQQRPYCGEERFIADEKHLLGPLPAQPFELKHYRELKVAPNNHIYLTQDKHYYSVPFIYIGLKVKVIYTCSIVYIYGKGEQIPVHERKNLLGLYFSTEINRRTGASGRHKNRIPQSCQSSRQWEL